VSSILIKFDVFYSVLLKFKHTWVKGKPSRYLSEEYRASLTCYEFWNDFWHFWVNKNGVQFTTEQHIALLRRRPDSNIVAKYLEPSSRRTTIVLSRRHLDNIWFFEFKFRCVSFGILNGTNSLNASTGSDSPSIIRFVSGIISFFIKLSSWLAK
jgi:hypothetical protein